MATLAELAAKNRPTLTYDGVAVTPYSLDECSICDGPTTKAVRPKRRSRRALWTAMCDQHAVPTGADRDLAVRMGVPLDDIVIPIATLKAGAK